MDSGLAVLPGVHLLDLRMEPFCSLEKRVSWSSPILEVRCVRNIHVIDTPMILCNINFWMFLVLSPILMALGCGLQPTPPPPEANTAMRPPKPQPLHPPEELPAGSCEALAESSSNHGWNCSTNKEIKNILGNIPPKTFKPIQMVLKSFKDAFLPSGSDMF